MERLPQTMRIRFAEAFPVVKLINGGVSNNLDSAR